MSTLSLGLLVPFFRMSFGDSFAHVYYFYASDRVKGLLQKTAFRIQFYPYPFSTFLWKLLMQ